MTSSTPSRNVGVSEPGGTPIYRPFAGLRPGITPHYISSSETSSFVVERRPGNTTVKRKAVSGQVVILEATKTTGAMMAQQMQDIADASRELEHSKIKVQLQLFSEQMAYLREKDRRLYENASIANDNARLSILKQGEMVSCLSHLSTVLSNSLSMNREFVIPTVPHSTSRHDGTEGDAFHVAGPRAEPTHNGIAVNAAQNATRHANSTLGDQSARGTKGRGPIYGTQHAIDSIGDHSGLDDEGRGCTAPPSVLGVTN